MHNSEIRKIGNGETGGKGNGFIQLQKLVSNITSMAENKPWADNICFPKTILITTDLFRNFIKLNGLEKITTNEGCGTQEHFEKLKAAFMNCIFDDKSKNELEKILNEITAPMAVRSSSLMEDKKGFSFAGKYESVFVGNRGVVEARREAFYNAIRSVFVSTFNPSALTYRRKHNLAGEREEMALLVQEVVGQSYHDYYLPALAGVAFSQNGYCWNKDINKKDGLVRLVFGLGTRAVGRGYVCLFSPSKPLMRPEGTDVNNVQKCSQKKVDVIDLKNNALKSVHFRELISDGFNCYPGAQAFVSLRDGNYLYRPVSNLWDSQHIPVLTMDGVLGDTWMGLNLPKLISWLLKELEKGFGHAVDTEFAVNNGKLFLLQSRPLSEREGRRPEPIPDIPSEDIICTVHRNLPTAYVPDIEYLLYVDEVEYHNWPHNDKPSVARTVGKLAEGLKGKRFAMIGPGRWGSWNPDLGVPVSYAEIANCVLLIEVARRKATYIPEVSFGSHFFQDLIEDNIAYLPLYPDEPDEIFNEKIFQSESRFESFMPDAYYRKFDKILKLIHVPTIMNGRMAHAILNGEMEKAMVFIK